MWPVYRAAIARHVADKLTASEAKTPASLLGEVEKDTAVG